MMKSDSIAALATALSAFQGVIKAAPKKEINPFYRSRYADLATIWETIRVPLAANGLSVSQLPNFEGDKITLTTLLLHSSGEWLASELVMVPMHQSKEEGWAPSMDPQSVGKAIAYARRYGMSAILGVVADEDDDGESGTDHTSEGAESGQTTQPAAANPKGLCPIHRVAFQHRQGTGAKGPYDFWSCPQKGGAGYCKERPVDTGDVVETPSDRPMPQATAIPQAQAVVPRGPPPPQAQASPPSGPPPIAVPAAPVGTPTPLSMQQVMVWARNYGRGSGDVLDVLTKAGWTTNAGGRLREMGQLEQARHPNGGVGVTPRMVKDLCMAAWKLPEEAKP